MAVCSATSAARTPAPMRASRAPLGVGADIAIPPIADKPSAGRAGAGRRDRHRGGWLDVGQASGQTYVALGLSHPDIGLSADRSNRAGPPARTTTTSSP